jgi:uncharacterized membrane protein YhaH (DUF805 family)
MSQNNPYQAPGANVYDVSAQSDVFDETNPFSPSGRFGRLSYLSWATLVNFLLTIPIFLIAGGISAMQEQAATGGVLMIALQVVTVVVAILFSIRRFHDMNASGWWSVLMIVPLVNVITALVLLFKGGSDGANNFGPPRITRTWEKVLGYIIAGMLILGIVAAIALPFLMSPS